MKHLQQFMIIIGISFLGELCHSLIPAPIPASIYGMILLFALLITGILKLEQVKDTGNFLVKIISVLFICPCVGLLDCWDVIQANWGSILTITVVSFAATFAVSGLVTKYWLKKEEAKEHE